MNRPKKRSGFYFFMLEYRRNHQEHGRSYNNLAEVFAEVHSIWAKMSVKEQAKYVAQARAYNDAMRDYDNPLGSYHERFQKMEKERRYLARYRPSSPPPPVRIKSEPGVCQATTKPVVLPVIDGDLMTNEFYIISINYFCESRGTYYPAEMGIVRFSLEKGVILTLHRLIQPPSQRLPPGAIVKAKEKCESEHQLPLPPNAMGTSDYVALMQDIIKFMPEQETIPPIFCAPSELVVVENVLKQFVSKSDLSKDGQLFNVFPTYVLLQVLRENLLKDNDVRPQALVDLSLEADTYAHCKLGCTYHASYDSNYHCALSRVIRQAYEVFRNCDLPLLGIEMKPAAHYPVKEAIALPVKKEKNVEEEKRMFNGEQNERKSRRESLDFKRNYRTYNDRSRSDSRDRHRPSSGRNDGRRDDLDRKEFRVNYSWSNRHHSPAPSTSRDYSTQRPRPSPGHPRIHYQSRNNHFVGPHPDPPSYIQHRPHPYHKKSYSPQQKPLSHKSSVWDRLGGTCSRSQEADYESDPVVLERRDKEIWNGKSLSGYKRYVRRIPKSERTRDDPKTPPRNLRVNRRVWNNLMYAWRKRLSKWDYSSDEEDAE